MIRLISRYKEKENQYHADYLKLAKLAVRKPIYNLIKNQNIQDVNTQVTSMSNDSKYDLSNAKIYGFAPEAKDSNLVSGKEVKDNKTSQDDEQSEVAGTNRKTSAAVLPRPVLQNMEISVTQDKPLASVFRQIGGGVYTPAVENFERGKTIFSPGDPAERVYFLLKGAVKLSRVYEAGEEITVALLRENSVFGVLSLSTGQKSARFYHAVAFTTVELMSVPIERVQHSLRENPELSMLMLQGLASRIWQTEMMIETLAHRDMASRLVSFLLILCRDFGIPNINGITIDLKLSHQAIAEAIGSTRVTVTRLLGELRQEQMISIEQKKITVHNPVALSQSFA